MAYPVVQSRATGINASNLTSHPVTLPSIVAGDMLVVVFSVDGNPTVTASAGWTKLGQASNGTTVTGAVFWKLAAGSDTLTLTTSASEQSSHVSFRISGAKFLEGTSANGSSTNSDPPNLPPTGGSAEYLWIATRSGDSTVVATAAPAGFTNLQTVAGGGQGASTNTAELSIVAASQNPGVFTSATEQWVSWTLAAFDRTAQNTFAASYETLTAIPQTLNIGYAVLSAEVSGGTPWFSRLTDGFNTWEPYGSQALTVSRTLSAIYQAAGGVSATLSAAYRSWDITGSGTINGAGIFPIGVENTQSAVYLIAGTVSAGRTVLYQVTGSTSQGLSADYTVNGVVSATYLGAYNVAQPAVQTYAADYAILGIVGSVSQTTSATYGINASASRGFSATYVVSSTSSVQATFSAAFNAVEAIEASFGAEWWVDLAPVEQTYDADYSVLTSAEDDYLAIWQVSDPPVAYLTSRYNVAVTALSENVVDVWKYSGEVSR